MASRLYRVLVRHWMKRFRRAGHAPHLRAVFLGDYVSTEVITKGIYEKHQLDVLTREVFGHLKDAPVCLDIGANIGNHACFFAQHFERVIAFEPNPVVHALLAVNTMGTSVERHQMGLSDQQGTLWFRQDNVNLGASAIVDTEEDADFSIPVDTLDSFCGKHGIDRIDFIKIDVEGHEANVLRGACETLKAHGPVLATEGLFRKDPALGEVVEKALRAAGYAYFYGLVPRHPLAAWLAARGWRLNSGLMAVLLPEDVKRARKLEPRAHVSGENHALFIATTTPLPVQ